MRRKAIFFLYRTVQSVALPVVLLWFLIRCARNPNYFGTFGERFGGLPASWQKTTPGAIWLHAVSVGEALAALPLVEELGRVTPGAPVFVSVSTLAGRETAESKLAGLAAGVFYAPFDFVWAVRRVLRRIRPSVVVVMETEIWPNLYREAKRLGCGLVVVNGRISDRALPEYRRHAWLFGSVLGLCDRILAQSDEMRRRFVEAGAPPGLVETAGNLKYDFQPRALPADSPVLRFIAADSSRPVWIAASTSADDRIEEEDAVIEAQKALTGWRLIVAPRKPDRFERVARKFVDSGLRFTRRSKTEDPGADVLLLDSIGELGGVFAHGDVVFMGGTLADRGGHNVLEPAIFGKPVIAGPHLENFRDIEAQFQARDALARIEAGAELGAAVLRVSRDPELGRRGQEAAETQRGATARTASVIGALYNSRFPFERRAQPWWALMWLFSKLWQAGSAIDRKRQRARARALPVPVVSIGNITAGGTGKTPVTLEIVRAFANEKPGVLTRGHGRLTNEIVLAPTGTESFHPGLTGDEAQLYLRQGRVPLGIGADRYETGIRLLSVSPVRLFFLDDGFQHLRLRRNFDLVLIDALHPFGGGHLLPQGRLREPLEGLGRAGAFVITRSDDAPNVSAIEAKLRLFNPSAPVFRSRVKPRQWVGPHGEVFEPEAFRGRRCIAFCGLGNHRSFWRTLDQLSVDTEHRFDFRDHHRYAPSELRRLARYAMDHGIDTLVTTAKDSVNLGTEYEQQLRPLQLYWLEIGVEIENGAELIELIRSRTFQSPEPL
ncbi:MAG TPA: tetraacyldisaccharide 4'-kinase [Bryobacteraceae bacterium]|nr:tetraacyldisaccharide 4'-kinase [Bryobacteraceae bacterium]